MTIDLTPDPAVADLAARTAAFVRAVAVPEEERLGGVVGAGGEELRRHLQQGARDAGVFAPHVSRAYGGHGLDMRGRAVVFEEAGWSLFGPLALNIAAPDEGNMHLLEAVATAEQKEKYLRPLAEGTARSCFAMTEPAPGAGSDPAALATVATPTPGGWLVSGRKWFITGADGAAYTICMARTSGRPGDRGGATMFLIDAGTPGMRITRHIDTLDEGFFGGHCEVELDDVFVSQEAVLGAVDMGFDYAQVRLAPARLTHCMRWLGIACRAQEIAVNRAAERELFGSRLGDLGMVQAMVADSEIDLSASRLLIWQACAELDLGEARPSRARSRRRSSPRPSDASSTARCRSVARSASPAMSSSRATTGRCGRSASTTAHPRHTAGPSPSAGCAEAQLRPSPRRRGPSMSEVIALSRTIPYADLPDSLGVRLGPTPWSMVTQPQVHGFADLTHDHQWIHVDEERAKVGPFGTTIAHGYLTLSLVPYFLGQLLEVTGTSMAVNYGLEKVRFPAPVPVGSSLQASAEIVGVEPRDGSVQLTTRVSVACDAADRPVCVADVVILFAG